MTKINSYTRFKHTPMNQKALILSIPTMLAVFLLGGWLLLREPHSIPESQNPPVVKESLEEKTVWYEIPEIGIRFPSDQNTKDELVYSPDAYSNRLKEKAVANVVIAYFSTKTLESLSENCSAKNGELGAISRHLGEPYFPENPCFGGKMIKKTSEGYFCVEKPQAPCMDGDEYERNSRLLQEHGTSFNPFSDKFWESVEVFDLKR